MINNMHSSQPTQLLETEFGPQMATMTTQVSTSAHHTTTHHQIRHSSSSASRLVHPAAPSNVSFLHRFCGVLSPGKNKPEKKQQHGLVHAHDRPTLVIPDGNVAAEPRDGKEETYLARVFRCLDEDGDGKISPSELRSCMRTVGEELSEEDAEAVVESTDSDGDGLLGFEDFARLVVVEGEEERTRDLREAFAMYATTEGLERCITPESLCRMLARLGDWKSLDECRLMIRCFDLNGDGVLSFDEFRVMML